MKKIKIDFVDFWPIDKENNVIVDILRKKYIVEISPNPDYIFCSIFGNKHLKYKNSIKILVLGENLTPDFNLYDYAIGFYEMKFEDRYLKYNILIDKETISLINQKRNNINLKNKKFCAFVYRKNMFNTMRVNIFNKLNEYKKVDSGGKLLNNINCRIGDKKIDKIRFQSQYKFIIACENQSYPGYNTEKLPEAFASGGIPIYWGDPNINKIYNKDAFINCNSFNNLDDLKKKIIELDNDDDKYLKMLNENVFNDTYNFENEQENLRKFLYNIFDKKIEEAKKTRFEKGYYAYKFYKIYFPTAFLYDKFLSLKLKR